MKLVISTALLVFLAGLPAYALQQPGQDKEKDKPKPAQQEEPKKQEPEKRAPQPQEKERQQPDRQQEKQQQKDAQKQESQKQERDQADRTRQTDRAQQQDSKQQQQAEKDRAKQDKASREHQQQVQHDQHDQRDQHNNVQQSQRDGGNHNVRRIRQEDFTAHFGREHRFHVERRDDRRFNYGGYWFQFSDPWPPAWSYDDDVYVDDIDGEYYLIDPARPGIRILLVVAD